MGGGASTPRGDGVELTFRCDPGADLLVAGGRVTVHFLAVPHLPDTVVDYSSPDDEIRRGTPSWQHPGEALVSWRLS